MISVSCSGKNHEVDSIQLSAGSLLQKLKINPETVIVSKNGEIVTEDETISGNDSVEIMKVISGG